MCGVTISGAYWVRFTVKNDKARGGETIRLRNASPEAISGSLKTMWKHFSIRKRFHLLCRSGRWIRRPTAGFKETR